jgi:hypothetical protein
MKNALEPFSEIDRRVLSALVSKTRERRVISAAEACHVLKWMLIMAVTKP